MAIDGGLRDKLAGGTRLTARYKGVEHVAEVVMDERKTRYRLADGQEFKSPSAAGSAVMGGVACNGWRWWSIADPEREEDSPVPPGSTVPKPRPQCPRCRKQFVGAQQLAHHEANADRLCKPQ